MDLNTKVEMLLMSEKAKQGATLNIAKWLLAIALTACGIVANYHYGDVAWALRATAGILLAVVVLVVLLQTVEGRQFFSFAKDARSELRKVVWPTRQETIQTTVMVAVMVFIAALLMWGLDAMLMWAIGKLTG